MAIEPETTTLFELDGCNFRRLVDLLQKDDGWRKVAEFVKIFDQKQISSLSGTANPAESLLNELGTKLCTVETLRIILRKCCLYEALSVISKPEQMKIERQPTAILHGKNRLSVQIGDALLLEFRVFGVPPPKFQWFKDDQILIDQIASVLRCDRYSPDMEGEYVCCATQENSCMTRINSEAVKVDTLPLRCEVLERPDDLVYLCEGSPVFLKIAARGYPKPRFQWVHENRLLDNEDREILFIKNAQKTHSGEYRCLISNGVSDISVKTKLVIYTTNTFQLYKKPLTAKIALLLANDDYQNLGSLTSPSNDVFTISQILRTLGFQTICLRNLNLHELKVAIELFASLVKEDCFAFFYYAGHGFEMGDRFLLPIDSPSAGSFKKVDAVAESVVLQKVLSKAPVLFVLLLDMCLKLPDRLENPAIYQEIYHPQAYQANRNLIRGYSTTSHLGSYEQQDSVNGIYVNSLKKYLGEDLPILTILGRVNAEISSKCPEQMPNISYITALDFNLNNAVRGFCDDGNKILLALDVKDETICTNGAIIRLCKFKGFNNVLDIIVSNAESLDYLPKPGIEEVVEDNEVILRVTDLQRISEIPFSIELKINNIDFVISKRFEITNIFLDV